MPTSGDFVITRKNKAREEKQKWPTKLPRAHSSHLLQTLSTKDRHGHRVAEEREEGEDGWRDGVPALGGAGP